MLSSVMAEAVLYSRTCFPYFHCTIPVFFKEPQSVKYERLLTQQWGTASSVPEEKHTWNKGTGSKPWSEIFLILQFCWPWGASASIKEGDKISSRMEAEKDLLSRDIVFLKPRSGAMLVNGTQNHRWRVTEPHMWLPSHYHCSTASW